MPITKYFLLAATFACIALNYSRATEYITINPIADTTLTESYPDNNMGGEVFFNVGSIQNPAGTNAGFIYPRNRALLQFDIAGSLPAGAIIESVDFYVDVAHAPPNDDSDPNQVHNLHRMLRPWGEGSGTNNPYLPIGAGTGLGSPAQPGEANWYYRFADSTNTWGTPGGQAGVDYATNISSSVYILDRSFGPYSFPSTAELVADIQFWLDNPSENFGWMIKVEDETSPWTAKRFIAREDGPFFPRLEISYSVVPEPSVLALLAAAGLLGGAALRRRRN